MRKLRRLLRVCKRRRAEPVSYVEIHLALEPGHFIDVPEGVHVVESILQACPVCGGPKALFRSWRMQHCSMRCKRTDKRAHVTAFGREPFLAQIVDETGDLVGEVKAG